MFKLLYNLLSFVFSSSKDPAVLRTKKKLTERPKETLDEIVHTVGSATGPITLKKPPQSPGFTLLELLVVCTIIAILISIVIGAAGDTNRREEYITPAQYISELEKKVNDLQVENATLQKLVTSQQKTQGSTTPNP